jgi:SAM-dependent methyltransferase
MSTLVTTPVSTATRGLGGRGGSRDPADGLAGQSRTERHRADARKATGIHYTPPELARFLAGEGLGELGEPPSAILDPACGGGELLEAVWSLLPPAARSGARLIGLDTDVRAVEVCRARLRTLAGATSSIEHADFLSGAPLSGALLSGAPLSGAPLSRALVPGTVDLAIANPPYVRTQTLGATAVAELVRRYGIRGRVDLYMAFAFAMAEALRPGGVMALLCSNRFLTTHAGASLRRLLRTDFSVAAVYDLGDTRPFRASVLPAVVIATRRGTARTSRFVSVYRTGRPVSDDLPAFASVTQLLASAHHGDARIDGTALRVRRGVLAAGSTTDAPWTVQDEHSTEMRARLRASSHLTIGSLARIRVGIKTTADSVFIRDDWESLAHELRPEPELLHGLLTHHVAERWRAAAPQKTILYPHRDRGGRTVAVDLRAHPRATAYLATHRERLSARPYLAAAGRQWFEIWVPQRAHLWRRPKVVFPDIAETPRFFVDTDGHLVNGDCYWAATASVEDALLIAAIGNSELARSFYDAQCGNRLYAGRRRFMTQYVEQFPVPDPASPAAAAIVRLARALHEGCVDRDAAEGELEVLVRRSLGFGETLDQLRP